MAEPNEQPARLGLSALRWLLRTCAPTVRSGILAFCVCVVLPLALVAVHIHQNPLFSPLDEGAHYDYVNHIADGTVPRLGDLMYQSSLRAVACTGSALHGAVQPPCSAKVIRASEFAGGGYSYEAQQPPGYYAITVPFRWVAVHVLGLGDLTGTRAVGGLWLVAGLLLLWAAGCVAGLRPSVIGLAVVFVAVSPVVIYENSIVSNTAASVFGGSLVALAASVAWRRPGRWTAPVLFSVGLLVATFKECDALPAVAISALFAIRAWRERPPERRAVRWLRGWWPNGGALLAGSACTVVAWTELSRAMATINPRTLPTFNVLRGYPVGISLIAKEALVMLSPAVSSYHVFQSTSAAVTPQPALSLHIQAVTATIEQYVLIAGALAGLFVARRRWHHWLGLISLPVLYVGGIVIGFGFWVTYNADPSIPARYGLPMVPLLALVLVASVRGRWFLGGLWAFGLGTGGLSFYYMLAR